MGRLDRLFSTGGDGTGTTEMATTADDYFITPGDNEQFHIVRILVVMRDATKFRGDYYTGSGALATGITITKEDASGVLHTYNPKVIQTISDWGLLAGIDVYMTDFQTGEDMVLIRWTLDKAGDETILNGSNGEFLKFAVGDSLAALTTHLVQVQGTHWWSEI